VTTPKLTRARPSTSGADPVPPEDTDVAVPSRALRHHQRPILSLVALWLAIETAGALLDPWWWLIGHPAAVIAGLALALTDRLPALGRTLPLALSAASLLRLVSVTLPGSGLDVASRTALIGGFALVTVLLVHRALGTDRDPPPAGARQGIPGWLVGLGVVATVPAAGLTHLVTATATQAAPTRSAVAGTLAALGALVLGATSEELLFRGLIHRSLRARLNPLAAVAISSVVFSALHLGSGSVTVALATLALGAVLVWLHDRTASVAVPAAVHGTFDVALLVLWPTIAG
jgi:membrane protease YdiL (CAAX protease family)